MLKIHFEKRRIN